MGNAQSPGGDRRFAAASRAFSKQELEELRSLFVSLAAQSNSGGQFISLHAFQAYFGIEGEFGERLFKLVCGEKTDGKLTFEDLIIAKGMYEKGTKDDAEEFIFKLCDVNGDGFLTRPDLEGVIDAVHKAVFSSSNGQTEYVSCEDASKALLDPAHFSKDVDGSSGKSMTLEDFRTWCTSLPSVKKFLSNLLISPDSGRLGFQVPGLLFPENVPSDILILLPEYAWHIGGMLSSSETEEWELLYHSALHGCSFNTFLGNISNVCGPTVLIVKDQEGFIYGGYASQAWERHSDFYGDMKSFLFHLHPHASIYRPTGANNNIQWCAVNFSSDSIPNGVGFGGRPGHFGLFISASFDRGHTFPCVTFNSPCLAKSNSVLPEAIECWGVKGGGWQKDKPELVKGTVLDRFKEDRNMLKMVGIANSSE